MQQSGMWQKQIVSASAVCEADMQTDIQVYNCCVLLDRVARLS